MSKNMLTLRLSNQSYDFEQVDKKIWKLNAPALITLSDEYHNCREVELPVGYITDFRTGPYWIPNKWVPREGMWYVVHDWLYQNQIASKELADQEQDYWMRKCGVHKAARNKVNWAARTFGCKYWDYYKLGGTFPYTRKEHRQLKRN